MANKKRMIIAVILFATLVLTGCGSPVAKFHEAIRSGNVEEAAALLIEKPTLVDAKQGGRNPLFEALQQEQKEIVLLLIENGADVNIKDNRGFTPLHYAAQQGSAEIAEHLITSGANVNETNMMSETPLHIAVSGGHTDVVVALIAGGADVNVENPMKRTPLHIAARIGHVDVVEVLLAHGANINAKDRSPGRTPLHYAAQEDHKDVAEFLLAQGADVNARDLLSRTPLYWASVRYCKEGVCKEVVELLRSHGGLY